MTFNNEILKMNKIVQGCLDQSFDDFLSADEFIQNFISHPNDWIAFRKNELDHFVQLILQEVCLTIEDEKFLSLLIDVKQLQETIKHRFLDHQDISE